MAMDDIREAESSRAHTVERLAADLGQPPGGVTLAFLAAEGPEATRNRFRELRVRFMDITGEIEQVSSENQRLASSSMEAIRGTLSMLYDVTEDGGTYDRSGRRPSPDKRPMRLDRPL
jgi:hypothetical protein